jgi:aryl-alcohol dehydrogenase-like predicted oxidoreductase
LLNESNKKRAVVIFLTKDSLLFFLQAQEIADRLNLIPPCAEQPQYNLLYRDVVEIEYAPLYEVHTRTAGGGTTGGMGLTIFSPLACGLLTGKYGASGTIPEGSRFSIERYSFLKSNWLVEDKIAKVEALRPLAAELGATPAQLALAWCAANPNVSTVLTGATKVEQVYENVKALEILPKLTPEILKRIDEVLE